VTIAAGGTVSFAWSNTSQFHDVTFDDGPASGDPAKSGSFSRTFTSPGTYPFECTVHASSRPPMKGTVTVK
jgi:plastocyanin